VLAHVALRKFCEQNPGAFFGVMGSPKRDEFLQELWGKVRAHCDPKGAPTFDIKDVTITTCRVRNFPTIIVTMPPPVEVAEAWFVGIVLKIDLDAQSAPEKPEFVYLTLEKGANFDGIDRTILCAWDAEGAHVNYGNGPPPNERDFAGAIDLMLGRE
jgi:hypothetical protein